MTEPNVLGNISPAKFLFDSGNTQIINLWKPTEDTATESAHFPNASTLNGQNYQVPVGKQFYLLYIHVPIASADAHLYIQSNTNPDTATGSTTLFRLRIESQDPDRLHDIENCYAKFAAGDYVTGHDDSGGGATYWWHGWGVECDA